jgi:Na+/melibiose symporter-like transporter
MPFLGFWLVFVEKDGVHGLMIRENYLRYGVLSCIVVAVVTTVAIVFTRRYIPYLPKAPKHTKIFNLLQLFSDIRLALKNYNFRMMFLVLITMAVSSGVGAASFTYINTYFWELTTSQLKWVTLASVPGILLALRLVGPLGKRFEKQKLVQYTSLGFVLHGLWLIPSRLLGIAPANGTLAIFVLVMLWSVVNSMQIMIFQVMSASLMADIADEHDLSTGRRQEGIFFAAQGFAFKSVTGFGTVIMGYVLRYVNLPSNAQPGTVSQDVLFKMGLIVGPMLALTYLIPHIFTRRFTLSRARHGEILKTLEQRRRETPPTEED